MPAQRILRLSAVPAALFVLAGGYVHAREWLDTYRHVPSSVDGAFVVKAGFPVDVVASLVLALALVACLARRHRFAPAVVGVAFSFEAASLAGAPLSSFSNSHARHGLWATPPSATRTKSCTSATARP